MDITELKSKLSTIYELSDIGLNMVFLVKSENEEAYELKRANLKESVKDDLLDAYRYRIGEILENEELALINLSAADDRRSAIYSYDLEEVPELFDNFKQIKDDIAEIPYFSFSNEELKNLEGYFILLGNAENNLIFYRKQMSINLFRQGKIYLIKDHDTLLDKIKEEFLRVDTKVDLLNIEYTNLVLNIAILERHYEFTDIILKEANVSIESIRSLEILENIEVLEEVINDMKFARKLSKISKSSPVFILPKENILLFARKHSTLKSIFKYAENGKILLDTKKSRDFFLKLMNDDFLHSQLTNFDYLTPAKDRLEETV